MNKMWDRRTWDAIQEQKEQTTDTHGTTWMKLKRVLQNERSQTQNITCYMIPFICKIRKSKILETEGRQELGVGIEIEITIARLFKFTKNH